MIVLADEDFDFTHVVLMRERGVDVITIAELGLASQQYDDEDVLRTATKQGRAVVTFNRVHFRQLHDVFPEHAGIILCKRNTPQKMLVDKIVTLVETVPDARGRLFRIIQDPNNQRRTPKK